MGIVAKDMQASLEMLGYSNSDIALSDKEALILANETNMI